MKLRNKKTGETINGGFVVCEYKDGARFSVKDKPCFVSLDELKEEWEDYEPVEPIFDEKIRRGIRAWWDMQDNPFKSASVLCYKDKDLDGFYHWRIFGYIRDGEQKESTDLCFRTKKLYDYIPSHEYTREELCGEETE